MYMYMYSITCSLVLITSAGVQRYAAGTPRKELYTYKRDKGTGIQKESRIGQRMERVFGTDQLSWQKQRERMVCYIHSHQL